MVSGCRVVPTNVEQASWQWGLTVSVHLGHSLAMSGMEDSDESPSLEGSFCATLCL
jgi:hypothetical protein